MQHKCKVTVIDKKLYPDLQEKYIADPNAGVCPFYQVGQEFIFERYGNADDFWRMGKGTQCSEAWDCISRYIYTALQGGSIMHGWTNDDRIMIACCNDGTRPVIFKIERIDYKVVHFDRDLSSYEKAPLITKIVTFDNVVDINEHEEGFIEIMVDGDVDDELIKAAAAEFNINVTHID
ncbi:MAG: TIGR04076 family protein [Selenomonadaceae bacterium]|nr:TIGR04076 family protein [Selenomonadaceae bacterium]MBR1857914.1 TIGR04076 family protein [Selenomonadaceae bacterium]